MPRITLWLCSVESNSNRSSSLVRELIGENALENLETGFLHLHGGDHRRRGVFDEVASLENLPRNPAQYTNRLFPSLLSVLKFST